LGSKGVGATCEMASEARVMHGVSPFRLVQTGNSCRLIVSPCFPCLLSGRGGVVALAICAFPTLQQLPNEDLVTREGCICGCSEATANT